MNLSISHAFYWRGTYEWTHIIEVFLDHNARMSAILLLLFSSVFSSCNVHVFVVSHDASCFWWLCG